jgi:hypothetical protein
VVEAHNSQGPVSAVLMSRFAATHRVTVLNGLAVRPRLPTWFDGVLEIDQLLSVWEMRRSATPWLVMIRQSGGADVTSRSQGGGAETLSASKHSLSCSVALRLPSFLSV